MIQMTMASRYPSGRVVRARSIWSDRAEVLRSLREHFGDRLPAVVEDQFVMDGDPDGPFEKIVVTLEEIYMEKIH